MISLCQVYKCPDFQLPWGKRYAFLVVLGFSRVLWLQFFTRQTMLHVFEGLEAAFTFFGGVPRELLFDQMKAVVTKDERAAGGRVTENAEFLRFAHHWDFRVRACRPYRAKTTRLLRSRALYPPREREQEQRRSRRTRGSSPPPGVTFSPATFVTFSTGVDTDPMFLDWVAAVLPGRVTDVMAVQTTHAQ